MVQRTFAAMGSTITVVLDTTDSAQDTLLDDVPGWFADWERQLSRFDPQSDLSRLNAHDGSWQPVSPILWDVLEVALAAAEASDGLVTPTVLDALVAAGYDRTFSQIVQGPAEWALPAMPAPDWRTIVLDSQHQRVQLPSGLRLDLGGVAKGWAATQTVELLHDQAPVLVDAGGDIVASGPMADGSPWPIAVANPLDPAQDLALLALAGGAVATSGRDYRRWQAHDTRWRHHLIDPRSGQPAVTDVLSATVVAQDAATAELAAKIALLLGSEAGCAWLAARPTLAGLLVRADGTVLLSARMAHSFWKDNVQ